MEVIVGISSLIPIIFTSIGIIYVIGKLIK